MTVNIQRTNKRVIAAQRASLLLAILVVFSTLAAWPEPGPQASQIGPTDLGSTPWDPESLLGPNSKILYGDDSRLDVYEETNQLHLQWAASVCGLVSLDDLTENSDGTYKLSSYAYTYYGYPACEDEPFAKQPVAAGCTGFMVGSDLIATAGHCYDESNLDDTRFVFGFVMLDATTPLLIVDRDQVYQGIEVVGRTLTSDNDFAVIRVDRPITSPGATALDIRREGVIEEGTNVGVIGHPAGLPMKIAFGDDTVVKDSEPDNYFSANIDAYGGNSGSPVFDAETGMVEGILVRGPRPEFVIQGDCFVSNVLDNDSAWYFIQSTKSTNYAEYISDLGLIEGNYFFRATPTRDADGKAVISLTWDNPSTDTYARTSLVRSVNGYVSDPADGVALYTGKVEKYLDSNIQEGVEYFYSLFVYSLASDLTTEVPRVDYARATAGNAAAPVLAEVFGTDISPGDPQAIDLEFSQILYSPVGAPRSELNSEPKGGDFSDYVATIEHGVYELPVARNDSEGDAWIITMMEDYGVTFNSGDHVFPFFKERYSQLYVGANGYISPTYIPGNSAWNFPGPTAHFAVPRLSFLFADLAPSAGGEIWARILKDRLVITYDGVPEHPLPLYSYKVLPTNTFQVELFFSGHIRVTYLELSVNNAIVGLSDGKGVPIDPSMVFDDVESAIEGIDFSEASETVPALTFDPIATASATQIADAGDLIQFTAKTELPAGFTAVPTLLAEWNGPGAVPFADNGNGTGRFSWQSTADSNGIYTVRIVARLGEQKAYQDVRLVVGEVSVKPDAFNLGVSSDTPYENPQESRTVDVERPLLAVYNYYHPWAKENPDMFDEGSSVIYWYRNGQVVPGLTNQTIVSSSYTRANEQWYFRVIPVTAAFVAGDAAISPAVTVVGTPIVTSITPSTGAVGGGEVVRIEGRRLSGPTKVTFGGVPGYEIRSIGDTALEVKTPLHGAGTVAVAVTTSMGTGQLAGAFTFAVPEEPVDPEDKLGAEWGCGAGNPAGASLAGDLIVMLSVSAFLLAAAVRRGRKGCADRS